MNARRWPKFAILTTLIPVLLLTGFMSAFFALYRQARMYRQGIYAASGLWSRSDRPRAPLSLYFSDGGVVWKAKSSQPSVLPGDGRDLDCAHLCLERGIPPRCSTESIVRNAHLGRAPRVESGAPAGAAARESANVAHAEELEERDELLRDRGVGEEVHRAPGAQTRPHALGARARRPRAAPAHLRLGSCPEMCAARAGRARCEERAAKTA